MNMALRGRAFLAIWHDIAPEGEADYNVWHTRQHMPERVGIPGFQVARRYVDWNLASQRYFTLYEGTTLETFSSDAYRARLNNPTAWSNRVQPHFLNFARSACVTSASVGRGIGGALATVRLNLAPGAATVFEATAETLALRIAALDGVTGAHFGVAAPHVTRVQTRETELREQTGEDVFDAVVMVDGIGRREVERAMPAVDAMLREAIRITSLQAAVYDLAYLLTADDVA
jgi:hypothetical protein